MSWGWALAALLLCGGAQAGSWPQLCNRGAELSAAQHDRLLQLSDLIRADLDSRGVQAALVARSGTNLRRFGLRYSHAALALREHPQGRWAVRQLYLACDEGVPRVFDQGLAAFLMGTDDPDQGFVAVLPLEGEAGERLAQRALAREAALAVLAPRYQANAQPFDLQAQNCNQWLAELLAQAWAPEPLAGRAEAQAWLRAQGYAPAALPLRNPLWFLAMAFVPWVSLAGHAPEDGRAGWHRTTLPQHLETWLHQRQPGLQRVEWCHRRGQALKGEGWAQQLPEDCRATPRFTALALDESLPNGILDPITPVSPNSHAQEPP